MHYSFVPRFTLIAMAALFLFTFNACQDDDDDDKEKTVFLDFHHKVGDEMLQEGNTYTINGNAVRIDKALFYTSGFALMDDSGGQLASYDKYFLVKAEDDITYELGTLEGDPHVHMLSFNVGIDETTNHADLTQYDADDALAPQTPVSMHWSWDSGYIFLKIDGKSDTDGDGVADDALAVHIGKDELLRSATIMLHEDTHDGDEVTFEVMVDYAKLFANLNLVDFEERVTHTGDNLPMAETVVANIASAFSGHE